MALSPGSAPHLQSDRLQLVAVSERHVDAIVRLVGDLEVARWLSRVPHPYARDDAMFFVEKVAPEELAWAIELLDGRLAGVGGFAFHGDGDDVELGYWLGRPFWGQGIATGAARLMMDHAWTSGESRVRSGCFEGNDRSLAVLRKVGFHEVGRSRRHNRALGAELAHIDLIAIEQGC